MQSKDDTDNRSPKKGKDQSPRPKCRSDVEDPKDASSASAPVAEKKEEEHKTPPEPAAKPKPKSPDAASHRLAIGCANCLICKHRKAMISNRGIIDNIVEFPIERPPTFDQLIAGLRHEDGPKIIGAESSPEEWPPTYTQSYMTKSASPSGGSVLVLGSMSIADERQATSKKREHPAAKPPKTPDKQVTCSCLCESTPPIMVNPNMQMDQERDDLFRLLRFTISCPSSTLEEIKALVEKILAKGYTLDSPCDCSITPLLMAALENRVDVATLLLDYGADPNTSRRYLSNYTALHVACLHSGNCDSLPMIKLLLRCGANIRALTANGDNPLTLACLYGTPEMVNHIVAHSRQHTGLENY